MQRTPREQLIDELVELLDERFGGDYCQRWRQIEAEMELRLDYSNFAQLNLPSLRLLVEALRMPAHRALARPRAA